MRPALFACLVTVVAAASTATANAQGFDCRSPRYADERVICHDPGLAQLDEQLTMMFNREYDRISRREQRALDADEDDWVVERHRCGANIDCIVQKYRERMAELTPPDIDGQAEQPPDGSAAPEQKHAVGNPRRNRAFTYRPSEPAAEAQPPQFGATAPPPSAGEAAEPSPTVNTEHDQPKHHVRRHRGVAAASPAAAQPSAPPSVPPPPATRPAQSGGSGPVKPTIQWVNPPPSQ